jgi:8-hydroxy-5-deazaflavin:NADPH oxidoreductase
MISKVVTKALAAFAVAAAMLSVYPTGTRAEQPAETEGARGAQPAKSMRIGVIGAGTLGGTVGRVLVQVGYEVKFSSRHPEELASLTRDLGPRASVGTSREAAKFGNVLLFAVPYEALPQLGRDLKDDIRGEVVLDACNVSSRTDSALARGAG